MTKYWTNGYAFRMVVSQHSYIHAVPSKGFASLEIRTYSTGIEDCFDEADWKPCDQQAFIEAYCTAVNYITDASGIEHLTLIDNTSNPES